MIFINADNVVIYIGLFELFIFATTVPLNELFKALLLPRFFSSSHLVCAKSRYLKIYNTGKIAKARRRRSRFVNIHNRGTKRLWLGNSSVDGGDHDRTKLESQQICLWLITCLIVNDDWSWQCPSFEKKKYGST